MIHSAEKSGAAIYVIGLLNKANCGEYLGPTKHALHELANVTGGGAFFPKTVSDVEDIAHEIARKIRDQYLIGFKPPDESSSEQIHSIKISVNGNEHWTVDTRPGYRTVRSTEQ